MKDRPGQAELTRAVIYEIGPEVASRMNGHQPAWVEPAGDQGRRLNIFNYHREQTITIDRYGQAEAEGCDPRNFPLSAPPQFIMGTINLREEISKRIYKELQDRFQLHPDLPENDVLRATIQREARRISWDSSPIAPGAMGRILMVQLLGREQYRRTLRIAGAGATLREHGLICRGPSEIDQAHQFNPNAALIWLSGPDNTLFKHKLPRADTIIEEARQLFTTQVRQLFRLTGQTAEPRALWEIFGQIQPSGINRMRNMNPQDAALLAHLVWKAGVQPSFQALRTINPSEMFSTDGQAIIPSFIRESRRLNDAPREEQLRMVRQYRKMWPANLENPSGFRAMKELQQTDGKVMDWEELTGIFTRDCSGKRKTSRAEPARPTATRAEIREYLKTRKDLMLTAAQAVLVLTVPGSSVTLSARGRTILEIEQTSSGHVHAVQGEYWTGNPSLPGLWSSRNQLRWTTRGLWRQQASMAAGELLRREWDQDRRLPGDRALAGICLETMQEAGIDRDEALSRALRKGIRTLFNPDTLELAQTATGSFDINLSQYNIATLGADEIQRLLKHNPLALAWCMLRLDGNQEFNHPGQIITAGREGLEAIGVAPRYWRRINRLGMNVMRSLLELEDHDAATALSILGEGQFQPSFAQTQVLKQTVPRMPASRAMAGPEDLRTIRNCAELVRLCPFGPDEDPFGPDEDLGRGLNHVQDYVRHLTLTGKAVRSRTWKGLENQSNRWHHNMRLRDLREQWDRLMTQRGGWSHAWNSLIGETQENGLNIIPLTNEKKLLQESIRMSNCVFSYGDQAAAGKSRLFGMRQDGEPVATMEITLHAGIWSATQVSGPGNHRAGREVELAAGAVAKQYTLAWRQNPRHESWKEQA